MACGTTRVDQMRTSALLCLVAASAVSLVRAAPLAVNAATGDDGAALDLTSLQPSDPSGSPLFPNAVLVVPCPPGAVSVAGVCVPAGRLATLPAAPPRDPVIDAPRPGSSGPQRAPSNSGGLDASADRTGLTTTFVLDQSDDDFINSLGNTGNGVTNAPPEEAMRPTTTTVATTTLSEQDFFAALCDEPGCDGLGEEGGVRPWVVLAAVGAIVGLAAVAAVAAWAVVRQRALTTV